MEIENHKEEVPFEYYLGKYKNLDPKEAALRLDILYDENNQEFALRFMGVGYKIGFPEFQIHRLDGESAANDLLMNSLPAKTFIIRYLMEGQSIKSSGRFMTFREYPTYGELYIKPFTGRCLSRLTYGFGFKLPVFEQAMDQFPSAERISMGDIAYEFEVVNGYRMRFIFWEGDEEFPPSAQILYSDNFQFGFHAEDLVVAGDLSITTLKMLSCQK